MTENTQQALTRYLTDTATEADLMHLSAWVKNPTNKKELEDFIKDYYSINYSINELNTDYAVHKLLTSIKKKNSFTRYRRQKNRRILKGASILALLLFGVFIIKNFTSNQPLSRQNFSTIKIGSDKATLTLEDGSEIELGEKEVFSGKQYKTNGSNLEYFKNKLSDSKISYHYLTVPRGGKFMIVLSDGTKVWLNSDSKLKYPSHFEFNKTRKVELVYGEAYFDVTSSQENGGQGFSVLNKKQEINVLGTEFNIKAYSDEDQILTTLVEGKIDLRVDSKSEILTPGLQATFDTTTNKIQTKTIDVYNETSWKDGVFSFDNKPLEEIAKVLSRWYDVDFKFQNSELKLEEFIGVLSKNQDLEEIMNQIKNTGIINNYKIENNEVILI